MIPLDVTQAASMGRERHPDHLDLKDIDPMHDGWKCFLRGCIINDLFVIFFIRKQMPPTKASGRNSTITKQIAYLVEFYQGSIPANII